MFTTQATVPNSSATATSAALTRIVRQRIADGADLFRARATYLRDGKAVTVTATVDMDNTTWLTVELSDYRAYDRPSDRVVSHIVDALVDSATELRIVVLAARNRDGIVTDPSGKRYRAEATIDEVNSGELRLVDGRYENSFTHVNLPRSDSFPDLHAAISSAVTLHRENWD